MLMMMMMRVRVLLQGSVMKGVVVMVIATKEIKAAKRGAMIHEHEVKVKAMMMMMMILVAVASIAVQRHLAAIEFDTREA